MKKQAPRKFDPNNKKIKICLIGCGGFIGRHLLKELLQQTQWTIYGIDIQSKKIFDLKNKPRFKFIQKNYLAADILSLVKNSEIIISAASICNPAQYNLNPLAVIKSNFIDPQKLVDICAAAGKRLIHFSTSEVYGKTISGTNKSIHSFFISNKKSYILSEYSSPLILEEATVQRWSYACAKQLLERYIIAHGQTNNLNYTIIRPFNFIGPYMDYLPGVDGEGTPRVIACFMKALLRGEELKLVNGGKNKRVFTYIDDAIEAVMAILLQPQASFQQIFNIGNPKNEISIKELASLMNNLYQKITGNKNNNISKLINVKAEEFYGKGYGDSDRRMPDISNARDSLNWAPKIDLKEGLTRTIEWYTNHYAKNQKT